MMYENLTMEDIQTPIEDVMKELDESKCCYAFVVLEEWLTNIIKYGKASDSIINIDILSNTAIMISDNGIPFNVCDYPAEKPTDVHTVGGKGIFLIRKLTKELRYEYKGGKNCVTIVFA